MLRNLVPLFVILVSMTASAGQFYGRELNAEYNLLPFFPAGWLRHQCNIYSGSLKVASVNYGSERDARSEVDGYNRLFSENPGILYNVENKSFELQNRRTHRYISVERAELRDITTGQIIPNDGRRQGGDSGVRRPISIFGVEEAYEFWEKPNPELLAKIPTSDQSPQILLDRMTRAIYSTRSLSFAVFAYVKQLKFPPVSEEAKTKLRVQLEEEVNQLYEATDLRLRNEAKAFLEKYGNDIAGFVRTHSGAIRTYFLKELRLAGYIEAVGLDYVLDSSLPSRAKEVEVQNFLRSVLTDSGNRTTRDTLSRICIENAGDPVLAMENAIGSMFRVAGSAQLNGHHLIESEFVYAFNKLFNPTIVEIDYPSRLYQTCLAVQ